MYNRYNEQVTQYQQQFTTSMENDKDLVRERNELLKLQENNPHFMQLGLVAGKTPAIPTLGVSSRLPKKLKVIATVTELAHTIKSWNEKGKLEKTLHLQQSLSRRIETILNRQRPDFITLSAERAIAYDMFLGTLRIDPFIGTNQEFLKNLQSQARTVASQKGTQAILDDLRTLKINDDVINQHVADIKNQQALLRKGQSTLQQELSSFRVAQQQQSAEQKAAIEAVKTKLTRMGVTIDESLGTLIENNQEVRKQLTTMSDKLDVLVVDLKERKVAQRIKDNFQGVMDTFGFVDSLGQCLGNRDLCRIGKIGQAGVTIATAINALQGIAAAGPAALTPWMAIGTAALSIFGAFAKQGPDPHQITLDAINGLFDLIDTVRKEMHIRFDQLEAMLGKIYATLIWNFAELHQQGYTIQQMLQEIQQDLRSGFEAHQYSLQSIRDDLRGIASAQRTLGRYQSLEKMFPIIDEVTSGQPLSDERYAHLYHELNSKISDVHAVNIFFVGQDGTKSDVVKAFEQDVTHDLCHDFNIAPLQAHATRTIDDVKNEGPAVNPTLWAWEMSAMMALVTKRYPTIENINHALLRIHESELHALKSHLDVGQKTQRFLVSLRDDKLFNQLIANHQQAAAKFKLELEKYMLTEEEKVASELNAAWQNGASGRSGIDAFQPAARELFHEEKIGINPQVKSNWWRASGSWKTPKWDHRESSGCSPEGIKEIVRLKGLYVSSREKEIKDFKAEYVATKLRPATLAGQHNQLVANNEFRFFADLRVQPPFHYAFISPEDNALPILPMPVHYEPPIPKEMQEAEWLGLGKMIFRYAIVANKFVFKVVFKMNDAEHLASKLEVDYDPMIFAGGEGVWAYWVGGNVATGAVATKLVAYKNNDGAAEYWSFGDVPTTKSVIGRRDTIKRGLYHGITDRTENNRVSTPVETIEIRNYFPLIGNIKQSIKTKKQELTRNFAKELLAKLRGEAASELATALIDYSYSYYMLQAACVKGFSDHAGFRSRELGYFSAKQELPLDAPTLIRDRNDFLRLLSSYQDDEISFSQLLERSQSFFANNVVPVMEVFFHDNEFSRSVLDETIQRLSQLIEWYQKPTHVVADEAHQSKQAMLQEQNHVLAAMQHETATKLDIIKKALLGIQHHLSPDAVSEFRAIMNSEANSCGLTPPDLQNLLAAPPREEKRPDNDNLNFNSRPTSSTTFAKKGLSQAATPTRQVAIEEEKELSSVKSPAPQVSSSRPSDRWYNHLQINQLINHYLGGIPDLELLEAMLATDISKDNNMLQIQLKTRHQLLKQEREALEGFEKFRKSCADEKDGNTNTQPAVSEAQPRRAVIPINLYENHWVALYISYGQGKEVEIVKDIIYIDPFGDPMPPDVRAALEQAGIPREVVKGSYISKDKYQTDMENCGPWTVLFLGYLVRGGLPDPGTIDIKKARVDQERILHIQQPMVPPVLSSSPSILGKTATLPNDPYQPPMSRQGTGTAASNIQISSSSSSSTMAHPVRVTNVTRLSPLQASQQGNDETDGDVDGIEEYIIINNNQSPLDSERVSRTSPSSTSLLENYNAARRSSPIHSRPTVRASRFPSPGIVEQPVEHSRDIPSASLARSSHSATPS